MKYFTIYFNPASFIILGTQEVHLGEENTITATEVFLTVPILKFVKVTGCNDFCPVFSLTAHFHLLKFDRNSVKLLFFPKLK